jgi:hypothetical protein
MAVLSKPQTIMPVIPYLLVADVQLVVPTINSFKLQNRVTNGG